MRSSVNVPSMACSSLDYQNNLCGYAEAVSGIVGIVGLDHQLRADVSERVGRRMLLAKDESI